MTLWYLGLGIPALAVLAATASLALTRRRHRELVSILTHERELTARRAHGG